MPVRNLMQDIVINILDEVLKKEGASKISANHKDDIITYVLNRVPPRYVTSERGLLYGALDAKNKVQEQVDILMLIYEAINRILVKNAPDNEREERNHLEKSSLLPHIIGQVLEESTLAIIPDVEVTLMYDKSRAGMVDTDWDNPYHTLSATKGRFHFWPKYSPGKMGKGPKIPFTLVFRHPQFAETSIKVKLEVLQKSDFGRSQFIPIVLMKSTTDS
jgi:competence protein ComFB